MISSGEFPVISDTRGGPVRRSPCVQSGKGERIGSDLSSLDQPTGERSPRLVTVHTEVDKGAGRGSTDGGTSLREAE